jgi:hypothetical protein
MTQRVLIADWGPACELSRRATKSAILRLSWSVVQIEGLSDRGTWPIQDNDTRRARVHPPISYALVRRLRRTFLGANRVLQQNRTPTHLSGGQVVTPIVLRDRLTWRGPQTGTRADPHLTPGRTHLAFRASALQTWREVVAAA